MDIVLVFGAMVLLMLLGIPVAFGMGLATLLAFLVNGNLNLIPVITQRMYSGATSFVLLAIPFYILAGLLMNAGGMTMRIVRWADNIVGHITGGMGHVNVLASIVFSGMSGSAVADAGGLGMVELEMMKKAGYDDDFSAAITAASSTIGPIFPPSIPFVVFGGLTGVSVGRLFLGGVIPGLSMGIALMVAVYLVARARDYPKNDRRAPISDVLRSSVDALLALGSVIIIVGGILCGVFTPTEAAVVACLYALILGLFVFRELHLSQLPSILWETAQNTVRVLFIIAVAGAYAWALTLMHVPERVFLALGGLTEHPWLLLLIINAVLLLLGCFMESISIMLLVIPILLPIIIKVGIDPVHFGVMVCLNLAIGLVTPPMGLSLYTVSAVSKIPVQGIIRELWPYIIALIGVLLVITYVPPLTLWLPSILIR